MGAVEIAAPLLAQAGRMTMAIESTSAARIWQMAAMVTIGGLTLAVSRLEASRCRARMLALLSAWLAPALLAATTIWKPTESLTTDDYVLTGITLVVLTAVASVPMLPWHALVLGLSIEGMYILSRAEAARGGNPVSPAYRDAHYIFLLLLTILATGIAAANYRHRRDEYEANQEAVRAAEALTGAQLRAELAESAIAIGKMAAALSHELNSPLGALGSSVDTLMEVTDRQISAKPGDVQRLADMRTQLRQSIDASIGRIQNVTKRLRRFVNLEDAELKPADLNELVSDVALLHERELQEAQVRLEFDLAKNLPSFTCRPQLLTAVFSTLLSNAIHAVNGDGRITILTRMRDSQVEVTVADNGRGMSPEQADGIFTPALRTAGSRVASGNWSLFNSRQIVYEHGGEIRVETAEGRGTAIHVTLPVLDSSKE